MTSGYEIPTPRLSAVTASLVVIALVPIIGVFIVIAETLGLTHTAYMAYLLLFYWSGIQNRALGELLPTVIGGAGGVALGWMLLGAPAQYGPWSTAAGLILLLAAVFCLARGTWGVLCNNAMMLFVTAACIPPLEVGENWKDMLLALLAGAAYFGSLAFILSKVMVARMHARGMASG